jgi:hypothetical protein
MTTVDIADVRPKGNGFTEDRPNRPAELRASPPLAPSSEDTIRPPMRSEDSFQLPEPGNLFETETRSGSRRTLIAGAAMIAALSVAGLTYLFLPAPGAKAPAESSAVAAQSTPESPAEAAANVPESKVGSSSESLVQPAPAVPEPSREASNAVPSPAIPAPRSVEASPQVAPSVATPNTELLFLQRPGVNIRSAPSGNAPVLGTAPKGTQFTATRREGDWVQVESPRWNGWISSQFLAPNTPL